MNDIDKLEELLEFYNNEHFDSDLKIYLSNELIGTYIINKYQPQITFNGGYDFTGIHWSCYLVSIIKSVSPHVYNMIGRIKIDEERLKYDKLSITEEKVLAALSMKLLERDERTDLGQKLAFLTKHLVNKRINQIESLKNRITELKKNG
jgi:hypothetical protein